MEVFKHDYVLNHDLNMSMDMIRSISMIYISMVYKSMVYEYTVFIEINVFLKYGIC